MSQRAALLLLVIFTLAIYLGSAWTPALLDDADAGHAEAAREVLQRGDWVTFYINGIRYLEKPPLLFWLGAISFRIFGIGEFAARLPLVAAVLGLVLICYSFGRRIGDDRTGLYAGLIFASSFGTYLFTRIFISDILLAFSITAALYCFWRSLSEPRFIWGFWVSLAGAVLAKGLIGMIFPLATVGLYIAWTRQWGLIPRLRPIAGALVFLLLAGPWHLLASLRTEKFAWFYFVNEHFLRYLGRRYPRDYDEVPLLLFWVFNLLWLFPWSAFLPLALKRRPGPRPPAPGPWLLFWLWAGVVLVFFSFSTRQEYYTMPAFPPLALLLAGALARAEAGNEVWARRLQAVPAIVGVAAALVLGALLWVSRGVAVRGDISTLLTSNPEMYRLSLGHMFDLTPESFAALRFPAAGAALALGLGFLLALWLRARSRQLAATLATACTAAAFLFFAHAALVIFEPYLSSRAHARAIRQAWRPGDLVVINGEYYLGSSVGFYIQPKVYLLNGRMTGLEFGSRYPDAPPVFIGDREIQAWWAGDRRIFLFAEAGQRKRLDELLPGPIHEVFSGGGKLVLSNR